MASTPWGQPPPPQQGVGVPSRIYRVRATGGRTGTARCTRRRASATIRDRRVRLSVPTTIQFYDLQDRLGYDQPIKALECLICAASTAIGKLPSLDPAAFGAVTKQAEADVGKVKHQQVSRSGYSSTLETRKGSELAFSRSDVRVGSSRDKDVTVASTRKSLALPWGLGGQDSFLVLGKARRFRSLVEEVVVFIHSRPLSDAERVKSTSISALSSARAFAFFVADTSCFVLIVAFLKRKHYLLYFLRKMIFHILFG